MEDINKFISALGRFTIGDNRLVNQLSKSELSPRQFFLSLITEKLEQKPDLLEEVSSWSDDYLLVVISGWLGKNTIIAKELSESVTLEHTQNVLIKYIIEHNTELRHIAADLNSGEMFRTMPKAIDILASFQPPDTFFRTSLLAQFKDIGSVSENYGIAASMIAQPNNLANISSIATLFSNIGSQLSGIQSLANNAALAQSPLFDATQILSKSALSAISDHFSSVDILMKQMVSFDQIHRVFANQMPEISTSFRIAEMSILTQGLATSIDFSSIGAIVGFQKAYQQNLGTLFSDVIASYSSHITSLGITEVNFGSITPLLIEPPTREVFTTAELLKIISVEVAEDDFSEKVSDKISDLSLENDNELRSLLSEVNPNLIIMLDGAVQAIFSGNVDRIRHFAVSLRELFTHIIHTLAPDDAVKSWSKNPDHYFEGRPTRKARLLFICRGVNYPPLDIFFKKDIDAALALMDLFQEGTHNILLSVSELQIIILKMKMESTLRFILEVNKMNLV